MMRTNPKRRPSAYRTPAAAQAETTAYAQDMLFGQYRNSKEPQPMKKNKLPKADHLPDEVVLATEYARRTTTARCPRMGTDECRKCTYSDAGYCDFRSRYEAYCNGYRAKALSEFFPIL